VKNATSPQATGQCQDPATAKSSKTRSAANPRVVRIALAMALLLYRKRKRLAIGECGLGIDREP
jgi:hypothetical protein